MANPSPHPIQLGRSVDLRDGYQCDVIYRDSAGQIWLSWPFRSEHGDTDPEPEILPSRDCSPAIEALQRKLESPVRSKSKLSVFTPGAGEASESQIEVEVLDNDHGTTWFAWPSTLEDVDPAIIPEPQILDVVREKELELSRQNVSLLLSNALSIRVLLGVQPVPDATTYGPGSIFLGFKREYLHMTTLDRLWHISQSLAKPVMYNGDTAGSTTFRAITESLGIQVLDSNISKENKMVGGGASFEVTVGVALRDSALPAYPDGTTRTQWKRGDLLVFKKPRQGLGMRDRMQSLGHWSMAIPGGAASTQARISRAVIHELRILSHPPLREHNNLLHLFGIVWDNVNIESSVDICPILVEPFADQGTLSQHVEFLDAKGNLPWSTKINFCKQVQAGLQALHSCNIFHGDIKPENILVCSNAKGGPSTLKLSDFGFSIIQDSGVRALQADGTKQVEFLGATRAWSAPEICALLDNNIRTISLDMARLSDIYSFGLVASLVALGGRDPFHSAAVAELDESTGKDGQDVIADSFMLEIKSNISRHEDFLQVLNALVIGKEDGRSNLSSRLSFWIPRLLAHSPQGRVQDISSVFVSTLDSVSPTAVTGEKQIHAPKANFTLGRYRLFYWKGRMHQISVTGVALELNIHKLLQEDDALCMQIFADLKKEADSFEFDRWSDEKELGLRSRAQGAYYSFQAFYAYAYGFCTQQDMSTALTYLEASAAGGYLIALIMIAHLEREYPERLQEVVAELPVLEAMAAWVAVGPKFETGLWFRCCSFLRNQSPEKYDQSIKKLRLSGYSELGENNPEDGPDDADSSFRGPDIRYLWLADGTIDAFEKLLGIVSVDDLILDFKSGRFSSDRRNQNGETALYVCCRSGHAEMTSALLSSFAWAVEQAKIANVNGRLPLHWLHQFEEEFVAAIGDALLGGGANIFAADKSGSSAIDYAVLSRRHDVVTYLLSKKPPLFTSLDHELADRHTLYESVVVGDEETTRLFLQNASLVTLVEVLNQVAQVDFGSRLLNRSRSAPCLELVLKSVGQRNDENLEVRSRIARALTASVLNGHSDIFERMLAAGILREPLSSKESHLIIITAAIRSQVAVFKRVLAIPTIWDVEHSQSVLNGMTQWESPNHSKMVEALLQHLNEVGQVRAAVNYSDPKSSCPPGCDANHKHSFPQTTFQHVIMRGSYAVARLFNPYVDHQTNVPTTLYHLLESPGREILKQIGFLLDLGPEYRRYVCDPLTGRNVLHIAIMNNEKYNTVNDFVDVLKTLKEWFLDSEGAGEDVSATDNSGWTALHFAAQFICPDAVEFLLSCGAQKSSLSLGYGDKFYPYDLGLVQFSRVLEVLGTSGHADGSGGTLAMVANQHLPIETSAVRSAHRYLPKVCKVLLLLSKNPAEDPTHAVETIAISSSNKYDILGLSPASLRTRRVLTRLSRGLVWELWGVLPLGDKEVRAHICRRDELAPMEVAMKIAQCTDPIEADILGGVGTEDDQYVYRFKIAISEERYEGFPFQISERLRQFLGDNNLPRKDRGNSDDETPAPPASVETKQNSESTVEDTLEDLAKAIEKGKGREQKPESVNSSSEVKIVWM